MKRECNTCGATKPLTEFHRDRSASEGRSRRCKACACAASRAWARENPERVRARTREWRKENPERHRASEARYRERNRDAILARQADYRQANREMLRARGREYVRNNLDRANAAWHRRHARKMGATTETFSREEIWQRDGGVCHICGKLCDPGNWHMDHIVPLSDGGEHSRRNVSVSHPRCNQSKNRYGPGQLRMWGV